MGVFSTFAGTTESYMCVYYYICMHACMYMYMYSYNVDINGMSRVYIYIERDRQIHLGRLIVYSATFSGNFEGVFYGVFGTI